MTFALIALGALPLGLGSIQNWYMQTHPDARMPYGLIALAVLLLWGTLAFLLNGQGRKTKKVMLFLHAIAAADLLLVAIQELIVHGYFVNSIGLWTQYFFLPLLWLGFGVTGWSAFVFPAYAASFCLLLAAAYLGCKIREKVTK